MFKHCIFVECPGLFGAGEQFPCGTGTVWGPGKARVPLQEPVQPEFAKALFSGTMWPQPRRGSTY